MSQNTVILADFFLKRQEIDDLKVNKPGKVNLKYIHFMLCFSQGHGQTLTRLALVSTHVQRPAWSSQPRPSAEQCCM